MKVSVFKNCKYYAYDTTIIKIIECIKNGEVKKEVEALRVLVDANNEDEYSIQKKKLPAFTTSGIFCNGRKTENLKEYNGCIIIDVDKLPTSLLQQAIIKSKASPYTYASFISPSNNGIKIISKTTASPATHKIVYDELKKYFQNLLNLFVDDSGSDIPRLCLFSYDPSAYLNIDAAIFNPQNIIQMESINKIEDPAALFEHCKRYTNKKQTYSEGNRNNYIHLLAHNCNRRGLTEAECILYSANDFELPANEIEQSIKQAYKNITEHNTNNESDKESRPNIEILESYLNKKYDFRHNVVTKRLEYKLKASTAFETMNDFAENSLYRELQKADIKCNISKLRSILNSNFCSTFDPFISFINSLPAWDNQKDYIAQYAATVTTTQPEFWLTCFRKWIVAMVGSVISPEVFNHTVIVFSGNQGIGKTTWMENIVPKELKEYLYSGTINPDNKDTLIFLSECMLINLDELENLNKSEIGSLKELVTKSFVKLRRAYGHNSEKMIRRASFAGSVNSLQFLNDTTGSRRFLCFEVLDILYQHNINIDLVLAQAFFLFQNSFKYWFSKDEIALVNANNEQYQVRLVEEELLLTWFEIPTDNFNVTYLTASEILAKIATHIKTNITTTNAITLGKVLNKHGFKKTKKQSRSVYAVRELSFDEVEKRNKEVPELNILIDHNTNINALQ